ncbi:MAG TPA: transketolase [Hyphomicrobiaceae bacterium]|jgi:pyruvate dehydrogenase E1 component|nr:transketolase [Hyphomicrobiaceae bacterium]
MEGAIPTPPSPSTLNMLRQLERKVLWLSTYMIHHANHEVERGDGLKVGGHQASSASLVTLMTALYFHVLRPEDRVAVKPHASPVFHAIQYLLGNQTLDKLKNFRGFGGAQSYPSRTKDADDVDFSTGSVGLGVAISGFASLVQDYVHAKGWSRNWPKGRMVALMGDAELDEGNVHEALLEYWKHGLDNCWWVIDYNRQSLDSVVSDRLFMKMAGLFENLGWTVVLLKYGKLLQRAFAEPGGEHLRAWIDDCPNMLYSALVFQGGAAWRRQLEADLAGHPHTLALLRRHDDAGLARLMTNLGGHDMETIVETFEDAPKGQPVCFIAYTIKGVGLPFQGHKDNHAGLMTRAQLDELRAREGINQGEEWDRLAGLDLPASEIEAFLQRVPFMQKGRRRLKAARIPVEAFPHMEVKGQVSTQAGFGRILDEIARAGGALAERIVTTSPDVTVSTNLGGWVNRRGLFSMQSHEDVFRLRGLMSPQRWEMSPKGQHIELGIAEMNLFLLLSALGLSHSLFGERLLPVGTLYDPFICRGLDALNYACYQDARFLVAGTPAGITLAPEGGAHQSIGTSLIGMAQDGLAAFEPAYVDELAVIMAWAFDYMQRQAPEETEKRWHRDEKGGSVYLRLTTRPLDQLSRALTPVLRQGIIDGGYWLRRPDPSADLAIVYSGAVAPEAIEAAGLIGEDRRGVGVLAVTSADRLSAGWHAAQRAREGGARNTRAHIETLLAALPGDAGLVTVTDAYPEALSWLGGVCGHRVRALGVEHFGQSGSIPELYGHYGLDVNAILAAAEGTMGRPVRYRW